VPRVFWCAPSLKIKSHSKHDQLRSISIYLDEMRVALYGLLAAVPAAANMYDVVFEAYLPPVGCANGCINWTDVASLKVESPPSLQHTHARTRTRTHTHPHTVCVQMPHLTPHHC
jgi:hypothetical protein